MPPSDPPPSSLAPDDELRPRRHHEARLTADDLQRLLAGNPTFAGFEPAQFASLLGAATEIRAVEAGACLVQEGDLAEEIFIILSGRLEVLKKEPGGEQAHRLAVLGPGTSVGEISLLDAGARSATLRALEGSRVLVIPTRDLGRLGQPGEPIDMPIKLALGQELALRLRSSNEMAVESLRERLRESELRGELGRVTCRLLIMTCLYMFALGLTPALRSYLPDTTPISVAFLLVLGTSLFVNIRTSSFPASTFGFNTRNWRRALTEALVLTLPVCGLVVILKLALIRTVPEMAGQPVFELAVSNSGRLSVDLLLIAGYFAFVPVQEMIVRAIQASLMLYLQGRWRSLLSILVAALLFSAYHLHISIDVALIAFPLGVFWGVLFWRHPTLIGVCASHLVLGAFGAWVVGFPDF